MQAVGGDDQACLVVAAVRETDARPGVRVLVADHLLVGEQFYPRALARAQENAVQVAAVDDHVREAVPALQISQVEPGQFASVERVSHDHVRGQDTHLFRLVEQPVLVQDPRAVGGDLDSRSDLAELLGSFQDANPGPGG